MSKPPENPAEEPLDTALTSRSASRRAALVGGVAVAGAAVLAPGAASAAPGSPDSSAETARTAKRRQNQEERGQFAAPQVHAVDIPDSWTRHLLSRFSGGVSDQRLAEVQAAGGPDAWFVAQLQPAQVPDPTGDALWGWFPTLALTPAQKYALSRQSEGKIASWQQMQDLANYIMLRRLLSARSLQESMVDFWSNLIHVPSPDDTSWMWRVDYEETIRRYALGRFTDLLNAAATHPAVTLFYDNDQSTDDAINESLGRELLECHTVGLESGFTQLDVVNSSRLLTGFLVDKKTTWQQSYDPTRHWLGRVKILGFASPNSSPDGRTALTKYLNYLAHHSRTAQRIATRLAVRFVSDTPSISLIRLLKNTYLDADTAIGPVLQALVNSDEFKASAMQKVRTPVEDAVATWAAIDVAIAPPAANGDAANQPVNISEGIGQVVYDWPAPDGFPDVADAWVDSGRMLGSMRAHWFAAIGRPDSGITYKTPLQWMPPLPATFDVVVDYVARTLLRLECTPTMLQAACAATDLQPTAKITETHALIRFKFPRLLATLLDTPEHLSR